LPQHQPRPLRLGFQQERLGSRALTAGRVVWRNRVFSGLVTPRVFLGQVISADHTCRAVARLIAHRLAGPDPAETGAYCQARKRLSERFLPDVACQTGRTLEAGLDGAPQPGCVASLDREWRNAIRIRPCRRESS
jgi:hypothetical protein